MPTIWTQVSVKPPSPYPSRILNFYLTRRRTHQTNPQIDTRYTRFFEFNLYNLFLSENNRIGHLLKTLRRSTRDTIKDLLDSLKTIKFPQFPHWDLLETCFIWDGTQKRLKRLQRDSKLPSQMRHACLRWDMQVTDETRRSWWDMQVLMRHAGLRWDRQVSDETYRSPMRHAGLRWDMQVSNNNNIL